VSEPASHAMGVTTEDVKAVHDDLRQAIDRHGSARLLMDVRGHGMAFFDLHGKLLCASRVLSEIVEHAPEGDQLFQDLVRLAQLLGERIRRDARDREEPEARPPRSSPRMTSRAWTAATGCAPAGPTSISSITAHRC
jgi:hypothetical protein